MMFCPDCESSLDTVPVGEPCPTYGGTRREAMVRPEPISTVALVEEVSYVTPEETSDLGQRSGNGSCEGVMPSPRRTPPKAER
jgi:hypothetical protein